MPRVRQVRPASPLPWWRPVWSLGAPWVVGLQAVSQDSCPTAILWCGMEHVFAAAAPERFHPSTSPHPRRRPDAAAARRLLVVPAGAPAALKRVEGQLAALGRVLAPVGDDAHKVRAGRPASGADADVCGSAGVRREAAACAAGAHAASVPGARLALTYKTCIRFAGQRAQAHRELHGGLLCKARARMADAA